MKSVYTTIILLLTTLCGHSQAILTEISASNSAFTLRLGAALSGDTLLLMQREFQKTNSATWISPTGKIRNIPFNDIDGKLLIGIEGGTGGFTRYYFLESRKKAAMIKCLLINERLDSVYWQNEGFEVPGLFVGSFLRHGLNIISAVPKDHILRVTQLERLKPINEKSFGISSALFESVRGGVAFFSDDVPMTPNGALASTKILLTDSLLMIAKDDTYDPVYDTQSVLKTTVCQFNLYTGGRTCRSYPMDWRGPFRSMIFDERLYRLINGQSPILQVLDLNTGEVILTQDLAPFGNDPEAFAYHVDDEKHTIEKRKIKRMITRLNYLIVDSVDLEIVVKIGRRVGVGHPWAPNLSPFGTVAALASIATNLVLLATPGEPSLDSFIYLKGYPKTGFKFSSNSGAISQKIFNHELAGAEAGIEHKIWMHVRASGFAYGIYLERKSEKIQVRTFR